MLFRNRELERAFEFIAHADFDIFCLQEVPVEFLERLKSLPYHLAYRIESERLLEDSVMPIYVAILSKHPIESTHEIAFPDYRSRLPMRTRGFIRLMKPFGFSFVRNRGALSADIRVPGMRELVRVFNLHIILANPDWRLAEFEAAMANHDARRPAVVCGDFNILQAPHINILNWFFGDSFLSTLLFRRERVHIEKRFAVYALANPLRGSVTHPFSRSQLDHILVSPYFSIKDVDVIRDRRGSDHCPIMAVVT